MINDRFKKYQEFHVQNRECLICEKNSKKNDKELWATDEYFSAIKCNKCNLVIISPSLNQEGLNTYYNDYIGNRFKQKKKFEDRKFQYEIDKNFIERYISTGKILDVGCNGGFFLNALSDNFNKKGIEIDAKAVEFARNEFGLNVINGELGDDNFQQGSFDLIIFRGVIEHLIDPKKVLKRSHKLLKKGGLIYFCATPNLDSFCAEIYRDKWKLFHPIEHINIFSVKTLHRLLGLNRFSIIDQQYDYLGTPYENQKEDYLKLTNDIILKHQGRWNEVDKSPPFWGNMMSVIFKKI
tara:strand:+ start:3211 stop:4095 length:885 start_codon:yes stop_codon:yes gene_type:complete